MKFNFFSILIMFQFSDDFNENFEDLLNVTLNDGDNTAECINETENSHKVHDTKEVNNEINLMFDSFDNSEVILTTSIEVNTHFKKKCNKNISIDNTNKELTKNENEFHVESGKKITLHNLSVVTADVSPSLENESCYHKQSLRPHKVRNDLFNLNNFAVFNSDLVEYERKFPGPAGLFAKNLPEYNLLVEKQTVNDIPKSEPEINVNYQNLFENNSWQQLLMDVSAKSKWLRRIINEYNIASVKRMNLIKQKSRKIPYFAAVIHQLDPSSSDPDIILKDPSGQIHGFLHKDLWELYSQLLPVGSAVLFKEISLLHINNSRKLYLNITKNNIATIYTFQSNKKEVLITHVSPILEYDLKKITTENNSLIKSIKTNSFIDKSKNIITGNNFDSLKIIKTTPNFQNVDLPSANSNDINVSLLQNCYVPPTFQLNTDHAAFSFSSSTHNKTSSSAEILGKNYINEIRNKSYSISVLNELEGIDEESMFDNF